jgi:hypothetical protein
MRNLITALVLMASVTVNANQNSGSEVSFFDHSVWNTLLEANVSAAGNVNYKGIKASETKLDRYLNEVSKTTVDENIWSKNEQLAFWINAYNAFTVKLILNNYPVKSINDIATPWDKKFFKIGGKKMNLNYIEHKILRVKFKEPRIHFAIVCASFSCPKLSNKAFTAQNTQNQLAALTTGFVNDPKRNIIASDHFKISQIFNWFQKDFTQNGSLINFLNKYAKVKISSKAHVSYMKYNWSLNE